MKKLSPSILSADFSRLRDELQAAEEGGADYIHIDVMDGHFVPNITIGPLMVETIRKITTLPLDVHLMITDPDRYAADFIRAGSTLLTVHAEACLHLQRTLSFIREQGAKPGVVLNPATPLAAVEHVLGDADMLLLMTVNPGFGGQLFIPAMLGKIEQARALIDGKRLPVELEVDGGITLDNIAVVARAGADVIVSGSAVFKSADCRKTLQAMRQRLA
jgi:ribulose-phosphate 3-epimerase